MAQAGGQLRFTQAQRGDFEALLALRMVAMRPSLERLGRFDAQRARDRLAASFAPEHTWHADWTPDPHEPNADSAPVAPPALRDPRAPRAPRAVLEPLGGLSSQPHRVGFFALTPAETSDAAPIGGVSSPTTNAIINIANYETNVGQSAYLDHFYLLPAFQGAGLGGRMLAHVLEAAGQVPLLLLALKESDANRFYVRHGFVLTHETEWDLHYRRPPTLRDGFSS